MIQSKIGFLISSIIIVIISAYFIIEFSKEPSSISSFPNGFEILLTSNLMQEKLPDIYYIILDEYAGNETLKENFNFNNSEFFKMLSKKGFTITENSYSNYPYTILSIPSSLNMQYLDFDKDTQIKSENKLDQIRYITDNNLVMRNLNLHGYYTVSFFGGNEAIGIDEYVNEKLCGEKYFSSHDLAKIYPEERLKQKRIEILCTFEQMIQIKDKTKEPIFIYAHLSLPHKPFVFNEFGELEIFDQKGSSPEEFKEAYIQQLKFANKMILKTIDDILDDKTRNSIIIVQSDHGERTGINWNDPTNKMIKQGLNNINAYYFPNYDDNLTKNEITPVNLFRIIFNEYFGAEFNLIENKYFWMKSGAPPFEIIDVTNIVESFG